MSRRFAFVVLWLVVTTGGAVGDPRERRKATFTVALDGLMVHVGDDGDPAGLYKRHLAILDAPGHEALLEAGTLRIALRQGDVVTFNLPSGPAATDEDFRARVPALRALLNGGTLHEHVKRGLGGANVLAYVMYPAGSLTAPATYAHPTEYRFGDGTFAAKRCVARNVVLRTTTPGPMVAMTITNADGTTRTERLRAGTTLHVTNRPVEQGDHFHMYRDVTSAAEIASVHEDRLAHCEASDAERLTTSGVRTAAVNSDCSNSSWP